LGDHSRQIVTRKTNPFSGGRNGTGNRRASGSSFSGLNHNRYKPPEEDRGGSGLPRREEKKVQSGGGKGTFKNHGLWQALSAFFLGEKGVLARVGATGVIHEGRRGGRNPTAARKCSRVEQESPPENGEGGMLSGLFSVLESDHAEPRDLWKATHESRPREGHHLDPSNGQRAKT